VVTPGTITTAHGPSHSQPRIIHLHTHSNYFGTDSFTYRAPTTHGDDLATVTITITAVNDAPIAGDDV